MAQNFVATGKFLGAKQTELVGEKQFAIRSFYIDMTDNPQYPSTPEFQLTGDKVTLVDNLQKGQEVQVTFNVEGRKYTNREGKDAVATNLRAWKINVVTTQSAVTASVPAQRQAPAPAPAATPAMTGPGQYATQQRAETAAAFTPGHGDNDLPF